MNKKCYCLFLNFFFSIPASESKEIETSPWHHVNDEFSKDNDCFELFFSGPYWAPTYAGTWVYTMQRDLIYAIVVCRGEGAPQVGGEGGDVTAIMLQWEWRSKWL